MPTDILIDQQTGDFVETSSGDWEETDDSRTSVMLQMECAYNAWPGDPSSGSRLQSMLHSPAGDPADPQEMLAEIRRCLGVLVAAGVIGSLQVSVLEEDDLNAAVAFLITWVDLATHQPVNLVYPALGGQPRP